MRKVWKEDEEEFLRENYKDLELCMEKFGVTKSQVTSKYQKMGLRNPKQPNIKIEMFENITTKEVSYILGYLWADGYINNIEKNYRVAMTCNKDDISSIEECFYSTGIWKTYISKRDNNNTIYTGDKQLWQFLYEHDYKSKSDGSPTKILNKIPKDLHFYFYKGLSDGDGCFYYNVKNYSYQYSISSTYEQDWTYVEDLYKELDIRYSIKRTERFNKKTKKMNRSSVIRITNNSGIHKIGNYFYPNNENIIGLNRKFQKYLEMDKVMSGGLKLDKNDVIDIKNMISEGMPSLEISEIYNVSKRHINSIKSGDKWSNI